MKRALFILSIAVAILSACKGGEKQPILPDISGKAGEVAVVASKAQWEAEPGNTIRSILAATCEYLPQAEPLYTLFNVPKEAFSKLFKVHRNILFLNVNEANKTTEVKILKDIWATPQLVIRIDAPDDESATEAIEQNSEKILSAIEMAERGRIIANNKSFEDHAIHRTVAEQFGGSPIFPDGYSIKKVADNFMWISYETTFTNQSILIYKYPYESGAQLSLRFLADKRNEITHQHIPCMTEDSYVIINPMIVPGYRWVKYLQKDFAEMRGLWEAHNDFMGGPFVSHTFLSRDSTEIITVDGFVYAPKYPKRNYLRQVEAILYSFDWE